MNRSSMTRLALLGLFFAPGPVLAQEPVIQPGQDAAAADPHDEMRKLFLKVEESLLRMDQYLLDASAGETSKLDEVGDSGIDDLLEQAASSAGGVGASGVARMLGVTRARGNTVLEDIDRILEIAKNSGTSCGSGSCDKPGNNPGSASTDPQQSGQTERMQGNRAPGEGQKQPGDQEQADGTEPKGNQDSQQEPNSTPAKRMPDQATETPPPVVQDADRWGELPIYARDLFRAEGGRDLPPQYRDWIDAYYRRLNKRSGGE